LNIFLGKQHCQIVDCCRGDDCYHPVLEMLGLVICNIVLGGGLELLVQFKEFMYPKLGMIHDFHFVWILRALSFKVTWYVSPPQMCHLPHLGVISMLLEDQELS
jgi:hypothetical protein